jgi:tRNA dimethylallyltransferase
LHERLQEVDPATARRLHPNDVRRLVRALEVHEQTGRPISDWQQQFNRVRPRRHLPIWLDLPRDALYRRIDQRVEHMLANGLSAEVKQLAESPRPLGKEARQALGYKELFDHLTGRCTLDEAKVLIQTRSRQFAKRQMTWFRHLDECRAVAVSESEAAPAIADRIAAVWNITSRSSL